MKKVGLALSGGGARGIAHLGVLAALDELHIPLSAVSGTSAGAIAAALYAGGMAPLAIKDLIKDSRYFGLSNLLLGKPGIFGMDALRKLLSAQLSYSRFEDLPLRLFVTATNLTRGIPETFSAGALIEPILASASVPVVFRPVVIGDYEYVDGGVLDNFPVEPLRPHCDVIIGSHVNGIVGPLPSGRPMQKAFVLDRCFHLAIAGAVYEKARLCTVFLDHHGMTDIGLFDTKRADELFDIGYHECMLHRNALLAALHDPGQ